MLDKNTCYHINVRKILKTNAQKYKYGPVMNMIPHLKESNNPRQVENR